MTPRPSGEDVAVAPAPRCRHCKRVLRPPRKAMCAACYQYAARTGRARPVPPAQARETLAGCAAEMCMRPEYRDGLCKLHADQAWYRSLR